ncbi:hypothetical protein GCM10027341_17240 [Spirosoma knui]
MTLHFTLGASDSPCVCCAELDTQLEVLNSFVSLGNTLVSAYLIDEQGIRVDLPVEAFDGLPIADSLRNLARQYQQVLGVYQDSSR